MRREVRRRRQRSNHALRIEPLESREMLAGDLVKVNFQTDSVINSNSYPELLGYVADDGSAYGSRGNGMVYGWLNGNLNPDTQNETRNRNNGAAPDERYDTLNHMIKGDDHSWQIDLPTGTYGIYLVAGDPSHTDQVNDIRVVSGGNSVTLDDPDGQDNWDEYTIDEFTASEGWLRLSPVATGSNQKLAFIEITQLSSPEPPAITGGSVTDLGSFSATLAGTVTDNGNEDPQVTLYYGTIDGGTNSAAWSDLVDLGNQAAEFATTLDGLSPDTSYFYRWRATNSAGTAWSSATDSFLTSPLSQAQLETDAAQSIQAFSSTITGRVTDIGSNAPQVVLYFGNEDGDTTAASWSNSIDLGTQDGSFVGQLTGLTSSTTYFYRVAAMNAAGVSWEGVTQSFATLTVGLPAVQVESATDIEAFSATMHGRVTDDGNDAPQIQLFWGTVDGGTDPAAWQDQVDLGQQPAGFAWTTGDLQHHTTYYFRAVAQNSAGQTWATSSASFTTLQVTTALVANAPAANVTSSSARLGGHVSETGNDAPVVRLYYGTVDGGTDPGVWQGFVEFPEEFGSFSTTLSGLASDTDYFFRAEATNAAGVSWASASDSFRTAAIPTLLITELMASNQTTLTTRLRETLGGPLGETMMPDWIEIYNPSNEPLSLAGLHLTDDRADRTKWSFPAGAEIGPQSYLVVFASSENILDSRLDERGSYHTSFKLSIEGEYLAVTAADGTVIHEYDPGFPAQRTDVSYGIDTVAQPHYYATATPGSDNLSGEINFVKDTTFSADRGFFTEPFTVEITSRTPGATIAYTVDGSVPSLTHGVQVPAASDDVAAVASLTISSTTTLRAAAFRSGFEPTDVDTQTYLFLDDVLQQSESFGKDGSGLPDFRAWGHAGNSGDWEVDPDIVQHADPENRLTTDDLRAVPTLSLVLPWEDMFVSRSGIYISGSGSPRAVSVEQILGDGTTGFQIDGSVQIQGGSSTGRWKADKLSMRLKFTEQYGPTKLESSLLGPDATDRIDTLVLDAVLNYGFHHPSTGQTGYAKFIQDQLVANLQNKMGGTAPHARYHHLYINGLYWGMYYVHERPDASFAAEYLGGDKDDYDALKHNSNTAVDGTTANYRAMLSLARRNLSSTANYQALAEVLDIEDFVDYMLVNFYVGNTDWAHQNWYASYNRVDPQGKWRYHSWDAEHVLKSVNEDVTGKDNSGGPTEIHQNLMANAEYRMLFADHVQRHMFDDGVLTPENAAAEYQKLMDEIDRAVVGETARWGDNRVSSPYTHSDWLNTQNNLLTRYFPSRTSRVLSQLRSDGLYPSTSITTPVFHVNGSELHGGYVAQDSALTMTASSGQIYFRTDGGDPRLPDGTPAPEAMTYSSQLLLDANTFIKARLRAGDGSWSALAEADFFVNDPAVSGTLAITEINYNPHESLVQFGDAVIDSDEFEFIELANVGSEPIELAHVQLSQTTVGNHLEGISFTFPPRTLTPGQRIVVVANQSAFQSRYGTGLSVAGEFGGRLNDGGELITLLDVNGEIIQQFEFNDTNSWPGRADGVGSTLEVIDTAGNYELASNWRSSAEFGGSPTTSGVGPLQDVVINEVLTHTDLPLIDRVELHNTTDAAVDIANWYLSDSRNDLLADRISWENTLIPAHGYLIVNETQLGFGFHGQEADDAWLVEADATGKPLRFVDRVEFGATQNGVSLGRWPNGSGDLFPMTANTFGAANSGPLLDSIVISEVHYHPAPPPPGDNIPQEDLEFVEIWNPTGATIDVGGWRLNRAVDFDFAANTQLAGASGAVIVPFDPLAEPDKATAFRSVHRMPDDRPLFGPYSGVLDNGGEKLELDRPEDQLQLGLGYVLVDRVRYDDLAPWPTSADGQGDSLHRVAADDYGDFTASWVALAPSPGQATLDQLVGDLNKDGTVDAIDIDLLAVYLRSENPLGDVNHDSVTDRHDLDFFVHSVLGSTFGDASLDGLFNSGDLIQVFQRGEYEDNISENSSWAEGDWNGDGEFDSGDLVLAFQSGRYEQPAASLVGDLATPSEGGQMAVASPGSDLAAAVDWLFAQDDTKTRRRASGGSV